MGKHLSVAAAGILIALLVVAALPGRSQQDWSSELEKVRAQLEQERERLRADWESARAQLAAEFEQLRERELPEQSARLQAQRDALRAQSEHLREEFAGRQEQLATHAQELAERALAQEQPGPIGIWASEDGEQGWLGVSIGEVTAEKAKELKLPAVRGVIVNEVEANSPAAKAGLKASDVITEFNGQRVEGTVQFSRLVRETPAGRAVPLIFWRDGRAQNVSVELGSSREQFERRFHVFGPRPFDFHFEMPEFGDLIGQRRPLLGIDAEDLSGQLGAYFGVPEGEGVLVREVRPGTPAEKAGLKAGDVIIKLDGQRVHTTAQLRERLRGTREKNSVTVGILRKGAETALNVEIERPKPPEHKRPVSRRVAI